MKAIRFVFCLFAALMLTTLNGLAAEEEDFKTFLQKFTSEEEGGTYISPFTVNQPAHKEFEAGYDESEPSLRVVFELTDGKWYVTDCYNDWYNFDLPINELEETIQAVQEENKAFEELHP